MGVIQRGQRAGLAAEASQPLRVSREFIRQRLDGDIAAKLAIVGAIYRTHAAGAKRRNDLVGSELTAQQGCASRKAGHHILNHRSLQEASRLLRLRQQQLDLPAQLGVFAAGLMEECLPGFRRTFQCRVEESLYLPPTFLVHGNSVLAV
jgi:hypothetical protein